MFAMSMIVVKTSIKAYVYEICLFFIFEDNKKFVCIFCACSNMNYAKYNQL